MYASDWEPCLDTHNSWLFNLGPICFVGFRSTRKITVGVVQFGFRLGYNYCLNCDNLEMVDFDSLLDSWRDQANTESDWVMFQEKCIHYYTYLSVFCHSDFKYESITYLCQTNREVKTKTPMSWNYATSPLRWLKREMRWICLEHHISRWDDWMPHCFFV